MPHAPALDQNQRHGRAGSRQQPRGHNHQGTRFPSLRFRPLPQETRRRWRRGAPGWGHTPHRSRSPAPRGSLGGAWGLGAQPPSVPAGWDVKQPRRKRNTPFPKNNNNGVLFLFKGKCLILSGQDARSGSAAALALPRGAAVIATPTRRTTRQGQRPPWARRGPPACLPQPPSFPLSLHPPSSSPLVGASRRGCPRFARAQEGASHTLLDRGEGQRGVGANMFSRPLHRLSRWGGPAALSQRWGMGGTCRLFRGEASC